VVVLCRLDLSMPRTADRQTPLLLMFLTLSYLQKGAGTTVSSVTGVFLYLVTSGLVYCCIFLPAVWSIAVSFYQRSGLLLYLCCSSLVCSQVAQLILTSQLMAVPVQHCCSSLVCGQVAQLILTSQLMAVPVLHCCSSLICGLAQQILTSQLMAVPVHQLSGLWPGSPGG